MTSKNNKTKVSRSKKLLTEAFFHLLVERQGEKITVQDICDKADYTRGTFYTHFYQMQDVVYYHYQIEWLESFSKELDKLKEQEVNIDIAMPLLAKNVFDYWTKEVETYKLLQSIEMADVVLKLFEAGTTLTVQKFFPNADEILKSLQGKCMVKGYSQLSITVYNMWIASGKEMRTEDITNTLYKLYDSGLGLDTLNLGNK